MRKEFLGGFGVYMCSVWFVRALFSSVYFVNTLNV